MICLFWEGCGYVCMRVVLEPRESQLMYRFHLGTGEESCLAGGTLVR